MWSLDAGRSGLQKSQEWTNDWVSSWVARMDLSVLSICDLESLYLLLYLSFEQPRRQVLSPTFVANEHFEA